MKPCKDCLAELVGAPPPKAMRPAPHPGPRCATHHRVELIRRRKAAGEKRRQALYGLTPDEHAVLLWYQGGACAICQKARGIRRALAVDHDHARAREHDHDEDKGCGLCVRGLLCKRCNRILGDFRDDPETFQRAAEYLLSWPSSRALSAWVAAGSPSVRATSSAAGATGSATSSART